MRASKKQSDELNLSGRTSSILYINDERRIVKKTKKSETTLEKYRAFNLNYKV
jgi:hypothetical protein